MDKLNRDGALANSGSHTLDGPVPDIAHREDAGKIGFEQARVAIERPSFRPFPSGKQIVAGQNEPARIALDRPIEPVRAGLGADKNK